MKMVKTKFEHNIHQCNKFPSVCRKVFSEMGRSVNINFSKMTLCLFQTSFQCLLPSICVRVQ